jgi:hypothetical protein
MIVYTVKGKIPGEVMASIGIFVILITLSSVAHNYFEYKYDNDPEYRADMDAPSTYIKKI